MPRVIIDDDDDSQSFPAYAAVPTEEDHVKQKNKMLRRRSYPCLGLFNRSTEFCHPAVWFPSSHRKYLHENGCPCDDLASETAARYGHLECLKYLHENGCCPRNNWGIAGNAAKYGHLECLKYLHENGNIWCHIVIDYAAESGHLKCLRYLHENKCEWSSTTVSNAAKNGHLECLKYLYDKGCPFEWCKETTLDAAKNGKLECLKYLIEKCEWCKDTRLEAAYNGYLECFKYLIEGCEWGKDITLETTKNGQLECLKYLIEKGCPWHDDISTQIKAKVWWMMVKDLVRSRHITLYWQEQTAIRVYSELGHGRKRDREEFEQESKNMIHVSSVHSFVSL